MNGNSGTDLTGFSDHKRYTMKEALAEQLSSGSKDFYEPQPDNAIVLGDHMIEPSDDFTSFECMTCGTELEVPEIFQASGGFNAIVYQLYIFGHFLNETCPGRNEEMEMLRKAQKKYGTTPQPYSSIDSTTTTISRGEKIYRTRDGEDIVFSDEQNGDPLWHIAGYPSTVMTTDELLLNLPDKDREGFRDTVRTLASDVYHPSYGGVDRSNGLPSELLEDVPKDPLDSSDDDSKRGGGSGLSVKERFASKMLDRKL